MNRRIGAILLFAALLGSIPARAYSEETAYSPSPPSHIELMAGGVAYVPDASPLAQAQEITYSPPFDSGFLVGGVAYVPDASPLAQAPPADNWHQPPSGNLVENGSVAAGRPGVRCDACPEVYGQVEGLLLRRDPRIAIQPVIIDAVTGQTFLSTADLDYSFDPGLRAMAGMRLGGCRALEFSYLGLFGAWSFAGTSATNPDAVLTFPGDLGPATNVFFGTDRVRLSYETRLHSFELNLPCRCCPCCCCDGADCRSFEWITGLRYLNLQEQFRIYGERDEFGGTETGYYNVDTRNSLYGAQLGARIRRGWNRFRWEATGKAGLLHNDAEQSQYLVDFPNYLRRAPVSGASGQAAFIGEINLSAIYRLDDLWGIRVGYNAIWLEGVALAPDQLDFTFTDASGTGVNHVGGLFLHGVNVGLEARW